MRAVVRRAVRLIGPRLYVMIETELWPNILEELHSKGVPVILANGRISDPSFKNYKRIRFIMKRILGCVDRFCMQSGADAERIERLGVPRDKICVTGNMKFDGQSLPSGPRAFGREYLGFAEDDEVIIAGSTHFPEERQLIDVYRQLREKRKRLKLILAPRHVERTDALRIYIEKSGLAYRLFSDILEQGGNEPGGRDVLLVDTIGHLRELYSAADVVFIGGSLAKKGGQNPIEAASREKPVVFGPNMSNFREVADIFLQNKAALRVKDAIQLKTVMEELLGDPALKNRMGENARRVIEENSGAVERTMGVIGKYLSSSEFGAA